MQISSKIFSAIILSEALGSDLVVVLSEAKDLENMIKAALDPSLRSGRRPVEVIYTISNPGLN